MFSRKGLHTCIRRRGYRKSMLKAKGDHSHTSGSMDFPGGTLWKLIKGRIRGSLTVEAALVLPVCLGAILLLMQLIGALTLCSQINLCLNMTARHLAAYSLSGEGVSTVSAYALYYVESADSGIDYSMIQGGRAGLLLTVSGGSKEDPVICLRAVYRLSLPGFFLRDRHLILRDSAYARAFIGGLPRAGTEAEASDGHGQVIVAENGVVYHTSPDCTYLHLTIQKALPSQLSAMRNIYGDRYRACEKCARHGHGDYIYITEMGDAWHSDAHCSGLTRHLHTCTADEAAGQGLRPCPKCGGSR